MPKNGSKVKDFVIESADDEEGNSVQPVLNQEAQAAFAKIYSRQKTDDLPHTLLKARRHHAWLIIISTLSLLLAVAVAVLLFFNSDRRKFGEEAVSLTLTGPSQAPSGQIIEYVIAYHNDQGVDLNNVEINLRYPPGFTFEGSLPQAENKDGTRLVIGRIRARESGNLSVRGLLVGEVGENKQLTAIITYEPANIKAQYSRTLNFVTQVVASVLNLELSSPAQVPIGEELVLKMSYRNSSAQPLSRLVVRLLAPAGFELTMPSLEPLAGAVNTWLLPNLDPLGQGEMEFKGRFTDLVNAGQQEMRVAVGILNDNNEVIIQEEKVHQLNVVKTHLTLSLTANDLSLKSALDLGQVVSYEVTLANEGELPFTDITLVAHLDTVYLDWSTLKDDLGGSVNRSQGTITWTKDSLPFLAALQPGSRTTVGWQISVQPSLPTTVSGQHSFKAVVEATATQTIGEHIQMVTSQSNEVVSRLNSRFVVEAEGRYYTDDLIKLGSGPLPPQVGQTTTYVIFWRLSNTINEVEDVVVTTTLPPEVNFTGQSTVSAGNALTFNPNTREVKWTLNRLPAGAGYSFAKPEATFEVAITPQLSDANKILVLTRTTTATARDIFSGANLITTAKFITTEIDNDLGAQGKGIVVP